MATKPKAKGGAPRTKKKAKRSMSVVGTVDLKDLLDSAEHCAVALDSADRRHGIISGTREFALALMGEQGVALEDVDWPLCAKAARLAYDFGAQEATKESNLSGEQPPSKVTALAEADDEDLDEDEDEDEEGGDDNEAPPDDDEDLNK